MNYLFLVPEPSDFVSGGNVYNQQLMQALRSLGVSWERAESGEMIWQVQPQVALLDTLYLEEFPWEKWEKKPVGKLGIIFHHLDCLELPFASAAQRKAFEPVRRYFEAVDFILLTSDFSRRFFVEMGFDEKKLLVIPPANDLKAAAEAPPPGPLRGLMVANLIPRKGVRPFLAALIRQGQPEDDFLLHIAGDDRLDPGYARQCVQLWKENEWLARRLSFLGILDRQAMNEAYGSAHAFISASQVESFGMALQEARAAGLPILAIGGEQGRGGYGASFVVPGKNGELAVDPEALAGKWLGWVRKPGPLGYGLGRCPGGDPR
jgi:glycosyltransferase involved in cell wall biosynthesis